MSSIGLIAENTVQYVEQLIDIWNNGNCAVLVDSGMPVNIALKLLKEND